MRPKGNSNGRRIRLAATTVLLLIGAAGAYAAGTQESGASGTPKRTIEVMGSGTATGQPDVATVRLGVESRDADVKTAVDDVASKMQKVMSALAAAGIADRDIATTSYSVRFNENPSNDQSGSQSSGVYLVEDVAEVTVRDLSALGTVLDRSLSAGANRVDDVEFGISDPSALDREARRLAYEDAKSRADQLAKLSGVTITGVAQINDVNNTPRPVNSMLKAASFGGAPPVSAGSLSETITLHVVYEVR